MEKMGRNDPCHCGSGKKYKNCHLKSGDTSSGKNKRFIVAALLIVFIIAGVLVSIFYSKQYNGAPGPAPEGKVWSSEHGHWHDIQ